jgi:predicted nucleic acid-binding protein
MRFCDTSVVLSWLLEDSQSAQADKWLADSTSRLVISSLVEVESRNRLRNLALNGDLSEDDSRQAQESLSVLLTRGSLRRIHFRDTKSLAAESLRLITHFSPGLPHGTLDVLHVASARLLKSAVFLTFDENQRSLARAAGMEAP